MSILLHSCYHFWSLTFSLHTVRFWHCFIFLDWYPRNCFIICRAVYRMMFIFFVHFSLVRAEWVQSSLSLLCTFENAGWSCFTLTWYVPIMAKLLERFHCIRYLSWKFPHLIDRSMRCLVSSGGNVRILFSWCLLLQSLNNLFQWRSRFYF